MVIGFILISGEGLINFQLNFDYGLFKGLLSFLENFRVVFGCFSYFGTQMVTRFQKLEEISSFVSSRSGFGFWDIWDLDQISRPRWSCGQFLQLAFMDGFNLCVLVRSSGTPVSNFLNLSAPESAT